MQPIRETLLNAVVATTTSRIVAVNNAGSLSLQFIASAISLGNGVFTVEVSNDGTNFIAYNRLTTNVTNTNSQSDARVASVTLSSNTNALVFFPPGDTFAFIRVIVTRTTDGTFSAVIFSD